MLQYTQTPFYNTHTTLQKHYEQDIPNNQNVPVFAVTNMCQNI